MGGDSAEAQRLAGVTNAKLLRIHKVAEQVQKDFGGKGKLIDALAKLTFEGKAPNTGWREKMEGLTVKRLLEKHRQLAGKG